jgi:DNA-binding PadR family transcriptional regulator
VGREPASADDLGTVDRRGGVASLQLRDPGQATGRETAADRPERRTYELTPAGRDRVAGWLTDVTWPRPDLTNFHLKLVVASAGGLADPVEVIGAQRRELVRRLREAQRAAMAEADDSDASLLLEGVVLRIEADLTWLDACERAWGGHR